MAASGGFQSVRFLRSGQGQRTLEAHNDIALDLWRKQRLIEREFRGGRKRPARHALRVEIYRTLPCFYRMGILGDSIVMRLVRNQAEFDHRAAIEHVLEEADQVSLAVAFLKDGGAKIVGPLLEQRLKQGAAAVAFVGTDFYITEPKALARLLDLEKRFKTFEVFLADRKSTTFHPKAYFGRKGSRVRCLIGSANLTNGAMATNDELSILATVGPKEQLSSDLISTFKGFRDSGRFQRLDDLVLEQYRSRHAKAERLRREFEKSLEDSLAEQFDLRRLDEFIRQYQADKGERDALKTRRTDREKALKVQIEIGELNKAAKLSKATKDIFEHDLGDLMSSKGDYRHLWHSGDIHRRGSEALNRPKEMIALFAQGRKAARLVPESGYETMRRLALEIPGVGVNMITEILCTFAPDRYAVFNGNTSGALAAIGIAAPKGPTVDSLSAERYARLCVTIDAVRTRVGGADFTHADAFLNWLYFKTKLSRQGS